MDLSHLKSFCQRLANQEYVETAPCLETGEGVLETDPVDEVIIKKVDVVNLINFAQIWTDVLDIEEVRKQFKESKECFDLTQFEIENNLYNLGFFYVRVNNQCSALEFIGLLEPIAFEQFRTPGTNLVSYASLTELFGDKMEKQTMQLMVLGDHFKYWTLVNPFTSMKSSPEETKLILSSMGSLAILVIPGYFKSCFELIKYAEANFEQQHDEGVKVL